MAASLAIGGLNDDTDYWVIDAGNGKVKLATSEENAHAGTGIDLTAAGTGSGHKLEKSGIFGTSFFAGDPVVFDAGGNHRLVDLDTAARLLAETTGPDVVTVDASVVTLDFLLRRGVFTPPVPG